MYLSPLFYPIEFNVSILLELTGLITVLTGVALTITSKAKIKTKLIWLLVTICLAVLSFVATPPLRNTSMHWYLADHFIELNQIIDIYNKCETLACNHGNAQFNSCRLTIEDHHQIDQLKQSVGAYLVLSNSTETYFGLFGFMGTRIGIWYTRDGNKPEAAHKFKKLSNNWYY